MDGKKGELYVVEKAAELAVKTAACAGSLSGSRSGLIPSKLTECAFSALLELQCANAAPLSVRRTEHQEKARAYLKTFGALFPSVSFGIPPEIALALKRLHEECLLFLAKRSASDLRRGNADRTTS